MLHSIFRTRKEEWFLLMKSEAKRKIARAESRPPFKSTKRGTEEENSDQEQQGKSFLLRITMEPRQQ